MPAAYAAASPAPCPSTGRTTASPGTSPARAPVSSSATSSRSRSTPSGCFNRNELGGDALHSPGQGCDHGIDDARDDAEMPQAVDDLQLRPGNDLGGVFSVDQRREFVGTAVQDDDGARDRPDV